MKSFLLWMILFYLSWPLALLAIILFPIVWILILPFRIFGIAVGAIFDIFKGVISLPSKLLNMAKKNRKKSKKKEADIYKKK